MEPAVAVGDVADVEAVDEQLVEERAAGAGRPDDEDRWMPERRVASVGDSRLQPVEREVECPQPAGAGEPGKLGERAQSAAEPTLSRVEVGEQIRFRYVRDGREFWTLPTIVAADESQTLALWIAPGSPIRRPSPFHVPVPDLAAGCWEARDTTWSGEGVLMLRRPETRHALWLFWKPTGAFHGWYVNLEDWWRTDEGVDAYDHILDIWVHPDGRWEWKDADELAQAVEAGIFTAGESEAIRAEGERVISNWPFPTGWEDWRPDPRWETPQLPAEWVDAPPSRSA